MPSTQQQTAATNIKDVFAKKTLRYAILKSQCQAGKTGAYQTLLKFMLSEGMIQRAYVLCGSHEIDLRSQAIEDTKTHNSAAYARGDIEVLFRQDFASATMNITNALIVVDESHLDQTQGQQLDMFLARHALSMDGNPKTLNEKNVFIVSVDATPYSELASLEHKETPYEKHVEELAPGDEYVGISDYLYKGNLKPTFDITHAPKRFASLFPSVGAKYALVRLSSGRKTKRNIQEVMIEKICRSKGYNLLSYTAAKTEIAITRAQQEAMAKDGDIVPCLEDAPTANTVVLICGRLRAGKVVPKKHIAFVWEGAKSSKTDALVQGLAGRMCGYTQDVGHEEDPMKLDGYGFLPLLFVPPSALERHENKVVKSSEIERAILVPHVLPTKATNLKKPRLASDTSDGMTQCTPLRLSWPRRGEGESHFTEKYDEKYSHHNTEDSAAARAECLDVLQANLACVRDSPHLSVEQKKEILAEMEKITVEKTNIRNLYGDSKVAYFNELRDAVESGTTPSYHINNSPFLTFVVVYKNYSGVGANHRQFFVTFYTKASVGVKWIQTTHLKSRIPETNGRSIFSISKRSTTHPLVGAGATGFCQANIKNPVAFEDALHEYITHWRTSKLIVSSEITSISDCFALDKTKFHYKDPKNNDVQVICRKLETEFGVKIKVTFARSSKGARGHFNLKSISW